MKKQPKLELIPVADCVGLRRNPQFLTPKQMDALKNSIERDGFLCPIIVRKNAEDKYEILAGNHRWMAASELNHETISAVVVECDDKQAQRIAVNTNTVHGDPTAELLAPFLAGMDDDVLKSIYLDKETLDELLNFDAILAERLKDLEPPPSLDRDSVRSPLPNCVCPKCGKKHSSVVLD